MAGQVAESKRIKYIAHNEGIKGAAIKMRAALLDKGYVSTNLDVLKPGADLFFTTLHTTPKEVGVQRKTTLDFLLSYWDNRLQREMETLMQCVDVPVLLLEGNGYYDRETGGIRTLYGSVLTRGGKVIPYDSFLHAFNDLLLSAPGNFGVVLSPSLEYTIRWATDTGLSHFDRYDKPDHWKRPELSQKFTCKPLQFLTALDGVGVETAEVLWKELGTPGEAYIALRLGTAESIPGIGKGIINKVRQQANAKWGDWHNEDGTLKGL